MADVESPSDLRFDRQRVEDPAACAREAHAASWSVLCGDGSATMEGGTSYASVQAAVPESANIVSDPPQVLDMDPAREHVAALGALPRPLVTRRTADRAPLAGSDGLRAWVVQDLQELS